MIKIKGLSKTIRRKKILDNIDLQTNGITGIIGPNGAGKSTLMKVIAGVEEGNIDYEIAFDGRKRGEVNIGYLPQNFFVHQNLTVYEVLKLLSALKAVEKNNIDHLLNLLNLYTYKNKKIQELSGGVYRKVGIAQALIGNPDYLIIDEPTAGLDIEERIKLRNLLLKITSEVQIVVSSHLPEDIEFICNHVIVMNEGKKKFEGNLTDMIQLSKGMIYSSIVRSEKFHHIEGGDIVNMKRISNGKVEITFLSNPSTINSSNFKEKKPDFQGSYMLLTQGDVL